MLLARVFLSLRFRLLLLATLAMVPAFAIVLDDNALQRQPRLREPTTRRTASRTSHQADRPLRDR